MSDLDDFKATYFDECSELLTELEEQFAAIEEGERGSDRLNAVFRAIHSIKGGAGAFGFSALVGFAHAYETLLDYVRDGRVELTDDVVVLCIRANDIVADFVNNYDEARERCWIAEHNGENVGCVMLVKDAAPDVARIRLLLVDRQGRGLHLGTRLVDECVKFARAAGYKKMTLWTHSILAAARHVYEKAGFTLTASEPKHSWGKDVVAEYWDMTL